ncbi:hypothetical protein ACHMWU_09800 [Aeromicrobium sp. UC242_57]
MNPRHRRLLFPGLLLALLIVVVVSALANKADAAASPDAAGPGRVSQLTDPRITESSGLVVSRDHDDLVYTINDSGNDSLVFAVQLSTGKTVGTATPDRDFVDAEALSIDSESTLWVADTGDNNRVRSDVALYAFAEPGPRDAAVATTRYPLVYPEGPRDVEALVIDPRTDAKFLLTKGLLGGEVFALPEPLKADQPNRVTAVDATVPGMMTDAAFTPDGRHVVARNYVKASVLDAETWKSVGSVRLPAVKQGETLAMEPAGTSFLVGSEGADSPIDRVALTQPSAEQTTPSPATTRKPSPEPIGGGNGFAGSTWLWASVAVALLAAVAVLANRRR